MITCLSLCSDLVQIQLHLTVALVGVHQFVQCGPYYRGGAVQIRGGGPVCVATGLPTHYKPGHWQGS